MYICGMGCVSCLGTNWRATWNALLAGRRAPVATLSKLHGLALDTPLADVANTVRSLKGHRFLVGPASRIAAQCAQEALASAKGYAPDAVYLGSNHAESDVLAELVANKNADACSSLWRSLFIDPMTSHLTPLFPGANVTHLTSACCSSLHALLAAQLKLTIDGKTAMVIGADALSLTGTLGFTRIGAATRGHCAPLQSGHHGMLVSEGAAALVMTREPDVHSKTATRLVSVGMSCEPECLVTSSKSGESLERALRIALARGKLDPHDISAIVLHGTGTPSNDIVEAAVCRRVFGDGGIPCVSIKAAIGHTMGAAGLFNCLVAAEASRLGILPPTVGEGGGPLEGLDLVLGASRRIPVDTPVMAIASGFGGNHMAVIFCSKERRAE